MDPAAPSVSISVSPHRDHARVALGGELDIATAARVAEQLDELRASGGHVVRVDLGAVAFIDSSGIRVLLEQSRRATSDGTSFVVTGARSEVRQTLRIAGVEDLITEGEADGDGAPGPDAIEADERGSPARRFRRTASRS